MKNKDIGKKEATIAKTIEVTKILKFKKDISEEKAMELIKAASMEINEALLKICDDVQVPIEKVFLNLGDTKNVKTINTDADNFKKDDTKH